MRKLEVLIFAIFLLVIFSCNNSKKSETQNPKNPTSLTTTSQQSQVKSSSPDTTTNLKLPTDTAYKGEEYSVTITDYDYTAPYICPNHCPGSGSDKPGKCPVCGMELIPNPDYQHSKTSNQ